MYTITIARIHWLRRLTFALAALLAVAILWRAVASSLGLRPSDLTISPPVLVVPIAPRSPEATVMSAWDLIQLEAAGLVTLARPTMAPALRSAPIMPRDLVVMEAAGLVTLARPTSVFHVWGSCEDALAWAAAPDLCG